MALLRVDFYSEYLKRNVVLTAVIPVDKMDGDKRAKKRRGPYRTVYLLHGLFGQDVDWIDKTHVVETAEARDVALIMPSGEDGLYLNKPEINEWHGKFISEELITITRQLFPLSAKREDTALAGISIGAYTALINGMLRPDRFGSIIMLSGAFMRDRILDAVDSHSPRKRKYYERFFGDLDTVIGTEKDYVALAERFEVSKRTIARDLEALELAGVPLVTFPGAGGGVGTLEGFKVRRDLLSLDDRAALYAALDGLRSIDGDQAVTQLIARLVPGSEASGPDGPLTIDLSPWFLDSVAQEKLGRLTDAVRERRCVRLEYVSRSGRAGRTVEPAKLVYRQTGWYLHAYCRTREAFRLFKLKRIAAIDVLGETFEPRDAPPATQTMDAPPLLPPENEAPGTFLVELAYDAADEFALTDVVDARFLYREADEPTGAVRFRTDDAAWAERIASKMRDFAQARKP